MGLLCCPLEACGLYSMLIKTTITYYCVHCAVHHSSRINFHPCQGKFHHKFRIIIQAQPFICMLTTLVFSNMNYMSRYIYAKYSTVHSTGCLFNIRKQSLVNGNDLLFLGLLTCLFTGPSKFVVAKQDSATLFHWLSLYR